MSLKSEYEIKQTVFFLLERSCLVNLFACICLGEIIRGVVARGAL